MRGMGLQYMGDLEIGARLKLIIGLLAEASTEIEKLYAGVGTKEPEEPSSLAHFEKIIAESCLCRDCGERLRKQLGDVLGYTPEKTEENCYIRALKRLSPDLYSEIVDWKEAEGLPGLSITVRDGRRAIITFSVDLEHYHVLVDRRL